MQNGTRRDFIKFGAAGAVALSKPAHALLAAGAVPQPRAWVTFKEDRYQSRSVPNWRNAEGTATKTIHLDALQRYQNILGFGAAFTDASCYLFQRMSAADRQALLSDLFSSTGLGLSVARTCIGASDYSTKVYSFDDSPEPDPELKNFTIEHDREAILPTLRDARKINPDLFLFSSPWSPPGWMKAGGSMLGGSMRKKYYAPYAQYFVKFLQGYSTEGVKINAITVQNEVDTDQDGRMPAALWGQEYEIEFVKGHLGPALERASLDTKIWILDHNYNLWGRAIASLSDPLVFRYVEGVAWHGYVGDAEAMTKVHDAFPTKGAYWTEGGPDFSSPGYATDWSKWGHLYTDILRNWSQCIVGWNLLLDEKGMPNIGPFPCGGLVTVNSQTGQLSRSGQYWAFAHFSKVIQRGARVIGSQSDLPDVHHVALENPDGTHVLVATNRGEKQDVACQLGAKALTLTLEADSITTLVC
jgi:glucosylceramidase